MSECRPVGPALPPRRTVAASLSVVADGQRRPSTPLSDSIIVEQARDRLWESFERQLMPQDVRGILASTLSGEIHQWQRLFQAMFDSWPMLQKCLAELQRDVKMAPWKVKAYCEQGEKATPVAEQLSKEASRMLWGARPRPAYAEGGLEFLMEGMVTSYFTGIGVYEPRWENIAGEWRPMAYKPLSARFYGYHNFHDGEDRLMLNRDGGYSNNFEDFDEHRFIIGIHGGHPGHPLVSAPLRVLTGYWLAAVFGLEWFMKFANLFGIPFRWATYSEDKDGTVKAGLVEMMKNLGSAGWGVGIEGTKIEFPLNQSQSANSLPQYELLKLADEQCVLFMLGQSLTTKVSTDGGSRSLGDVHADVKQGVVRGICDFVGDKVTHQVIPAWSFWNTGRVADDLPECYPEWPEPKDEKAKADTLAVIINDIGLPLEESFVYEELGAPIPPKGAKLFTKGGATETPPGKSEPLPVAAADWSAFESHHGTLSIPRAEMPQIKSSNRASMVQYLKARGIASREETVLPATIKATQAEFSQAKVDAAKAYKGGNRAILISQDDHVVDGHHQWMAALQDAPKEPIRVIRLLAPIRYVLELVKKMPSATVEAALAMIEAGGFRTLDDGRVIFIGETHTDSPGDKKADQYRQNAGSEEHAADRAADRNAGGGSPSSEPSPADLVNPAAKPDDHKEPDPPASDVIDMEKARKDYEAQLQEEAMADFPEISQSLKGKLPRPEDLPDDEPLKGEVQRIWDRYKKETNRLDGDGRKVISPAGASNFFAAKGTSTSLDDLRQSLNEEGFEFGTPADMLGAVYESLEGRKHWGTNSFRSPVAASDTSARETLTGLFKKLRPIDDGKIADELENAAKEGLKGDA